MRLSVVVVALAVADNGMYSGSFLAKGLTTRFEFSLAGVGGLGSLDGLLFTDVLASGDLKTSFGGWKNSEKL